MPVVVPVSKAGARVLVMVGYGEQAEHHLEAMLAVRDITTLHVVGRDAGKAAGFAERARARHPGLNVHSGDDVEAGVREADIICTVTSSPTTVLHGDWVSDGAHVNVVGSSIPSMREIDEALVCRAAWFVDYRPSTLAQAGEFIDAMASGVITEDHIRAEIGEVLAGRAPGRRDAREITLYRSLGIAAQDLAAAHHVYLRAKAEGAGVVAPL